MAGSQAKRYLLHVLNAAQRGKDLVTQILSFSRKGKEELRQTDLASIVKESVKMLRASLPKTIEIRTNITTESSMALAGPTQIQQIIMNLGTNAAHAMREKGGRMTIELSSLTVTPQNTPVPDLTTGEYLKLSISDTGTGMGRDVLERVFDPFFTTKKPGEGTGLGLWVVHSIVQNHKGVITVKSAPGKGSTFAVFLPHIQERTLRVKKRLPAIKGCGHILVIDDEAELLELEKIMVERLGYTVTAVGDSSAAVDLFKENPDKYDLVLTDQSMPGMTGVDLARELISIRPDIPVAVITGYHDELDGAATRKAGVRAIIEKPMTRVDLSLAIQQLLTEGGH